MADISNREIKKAIADLQRGAGTGGGSAAIVGDTPATAPAGTIVINPTTGNICVFDNSSDCVPISETIFL